MTVAATAQQIQIAAQVAFGLSNEYPNVLFQYTEPTTTTAGLAASTIVQIPANTTDNAIVTATLFPGFTTPLLWGIAEMTNPGIQLNVGLASGGARLHMAVGGFWITRVNGTGTTFYIDNASSSIALLNVFALSN